MDVHIQILVFLFSFVFGFLFYYASIINWLVLKNKRIGFQLIIDLIFVLDFVFIYSFILYKINYGSFHIYFVFIMLLGMFIGKKSKNNVNKILKYCKKYLVMLRFIKRR